jgi:hypothetical protein
MIVHKIPHKARYIPTQNTFSALFLGVYNFGIAANTRQTVFPILANTIYFLDNFSLGGNIAKEDFLSSINTLPLMTLSLKSCPLNGIYEKPIPLTHFYENKEATAFVQSKQSNDELQVSLSGILNQTAPLVGVSPVVLTVTFSVYAMDDRNYNAQFLDSLKGGLL